jgi:hypothetical protein
MMTFIGIVEGTKCYIFMRSPKNIVFTAIQALFDKTLFPKCPNMRRLGYTPAGLPPDDLQGEHNGPPDNENEDHEGGLPPLPFGPAGQVTWQHMQPPQPPQMPIQYPSQSPPQYYPPLPSTPSSRPSSKGKERAYPPWGDAPVSDNDNMYMSRPMTPLVLEPTHPTLGISFHLYLVVA